MVGNEKRGTSGDEGSWSELAKDVVRVVYWCVVTAALLVVGVLGFVGGR